MTELRIRRGPASQLPVDAAAGEPLLTTDTHNIYVGGGPGVMPVKVTGVTTEVQAALEMKANAVDVGTAAAKDVPETGNAASGQVVLGNDSRLSNPRTPTAHKASHAAGGADALLPSDIGAVPSVALATYNVNQTAGVDNTGATECAAALQTAIDYAASQGLIATANGTYKTGSKVVFKSYADFRASTFNVINSPDVAVEVSTGSATNPTDLTRHKTIYLPEIINVNKPVTGWAGQGTGVRVVNLYETSLYMGHTRGFSVGLDVTAFSTGSAYDHIFLASLDNNKINLLVHPGNAAGWANEITFYGGRLTHDSSEGANVSGTRHIQIDYDPSFGAGGHPCNNLLFIKPSLEGDTPEYHISNVAGSYIIVEQGRWEATTPKVLLDGSTVAVTDFVLRGGYQVEKTTFTITGDARYNRMESTRNGNYEEFSGHGYMLSNRTGSGNSAIKVFAAGNSPIGKTESSTDYYLSLSAQNIIGKRPTDAYPRIKTDHDNGRVYFGNGASDVVSYVGPYTTNNLKVVGGDLYSQWGFPVGTQALSPSDTPVFNSVTLAGSTATQIPFVTIAAPTLGPELSTTGSWSAFTAQAGWSVGGASAIATSAANGYGIFHYTAGLTQSRLYQIVYTINSISSGGVKVYVGGNYGTTRTTPGTYTENVVRGAVSTEIGLYVVGTTTASISGLSVKEILSTSGPLSGDPGLSWDNTTKTLSADNLDAPHASTHATEGTDPISLATIGAAALPSYASNAAAVTGGLAVGTLYRQGDFVAVVH